ncbi:hypothetical protein [Chryseobacterium paludis]|uniref:hypothetical protein n=1 Tax=Chryseobacterium paludis TaxID=2956784 RepID=UPI0021C10082|nr:hypothetical protein [Chryseobacterium paludis]
MRTLETKREIIKLIFDNLNNLTKEDLISISDLCSSISNIDSIGKKRDLDILNLVNFYRNPNPVPAPIGEGSIRMFNRQSFSYLQKVFVIQPNIVNFLLDEGSNKIDIFLLEREKNLDVAYGNSTDKQFYYINGVNGGNIMSDFVNQRKLFEGNLKNLLDIKKNPNGHICPTKIMIDKIDLEKFNQFKVGKNNPQVELVTGINQDRSNSDFFNRVTLVMNFVSEIDGTLIPDPNYYFDTYHLCPPGTC